jgi:hypothetical protein
MPIRVKQADGSYKVASIKQKTPEEYEMEIHLLEQGRKEYVKDAVKRMQQLQRRIDILYEFVRDKDLEEIERRFEETSEVAAETKKRLRKHKCCNKDCGEIGTIDDGFMIDKEDEWNCPDCYSSLRDKYRGAAQPDENEESLDDNEDSDVSESETE